jgi:hypothetical protein
MDGLGLRRGSATGYRPAIRRHRPDGRHRQRQELGGPGARGLRRELVDTDAIARALTLPGGAAIPAIAQAFGAHVITAGGALDRDRMRETRLRRPGRQGPPRRHPAPDDRAEATRQAALAGERVVVFDVPLLAESSRWRPTCRPHPGGRLR